MRLFRLRHGALFLFPLLPVLLTVLLVLPWPSAWAQTDDVQTMEPVKAKALAGYVHIEGQTGLVLTRLKVEEWDTNGTHMLASTNTDRQGHFELKPMGHGKTHTLRISAKGFHTREYQVELARSAPDELDLEIQLASATEKQVKPKEIPR